jgi:hypothetical protein
MNFLKTWELPHWVTVLGSTFGIAAADAIMTTLRTGSFPSSAQEWQNVVLSGVGAGVAAIIALYRTKPGNISIPIKRMIPPPVEEDHETIIP